MKVYIGNYEDRPKGVEKEHVFDTTHPRTHGKILQQIRYEAPNCEFWTNHVYVVDACEFEEVFVCNGDKVSSIMNHPDFERWKDEFSPGEMWTMFGEKWI